MVSLRDERGSLHALKAHSQACLSRLFVHAIELGSPYILMRMVLSAGKPAQSETVFARYAFPLPLVRQFKSSNGFVSMNTALAE